MLYTMADLSDVWVLAQVFQSVQARSSGDPAEVTVDAYPGRVFSGRVDYPPAAGHEHAHAASAIGVCESWSKLRPECM